MKEKSTLTFLRGDIQRSIDEALVHICTLFDQCNLCKTCKITIVVSVRIKYTSIFY